MKNINKEKLTAYALGELAGSERAEIEEMIKNNPELKKEVEDIQSFGTFLSKELKTEELPQIEEEKRGSLLDSMTVKAKSGWSGFFKGYTFPVGVIMSAMIAMVVLIPYLKDAVSGKSTQLHGKIGSFDPSAPQEGLEVTLDLKEEANRPQLIPREQVAQGEPASPSVGAKKAKPKTVAKLGSSLKRDDKAVGDGYIAKESQTQMLAANDMDLADAAGSAAPSKGVSYGMGGLAQSEIKLKKKRKLKKMRSFAPGRTDDFESHPPSYLPGRSSRGESYEQLPENPFKGVSGAPLSTFSIDVDTASYTNIRRYLTQFNQVPPAHSVRIEEMINYFDYQDPTPTGDTPFSVNMEVADSPWSEGHKLVRIGIKGKTVESKNRRSNLVFLVDVSGSMTSHDKLGLLKEGLHKLVEQLGEEDRVSLVTYAGNAAVVLDSTSADRKKEIHQAIDQLAAGGGTHGSEGIKTAYALAKKGFRQNGVNRVILATDGDFNVGVTSNDALVDMVKERASENIFLTVLGFGTGNLNDAMMEQISNKGNGNYFYIDSDKEAKKVLVDKLQGTLVTIAKDVKIQVEFNPNNVAEYRLIGYENRQLKAKDFNDDKKDAGEIGAGHAVVALYEIKPKGFETDGVDALKYQKAKKKEEPVKKSASFSDELLTVKLRYKEPTGTKSKLLTFPVKKASKTFDKASADLRWTASVAGFGMLLKGSTHKGTLTYAKLIKMANDARWSGKGYDSYRSELVELIKKAKSFSGQ